ncbi:MAG: hypothetical protein JST84_18180 [Acidobacteria bacterium]|nr:hypothetical protein [Acidobacteriota bacterium]
MIRVAYFDQSALSDLCLEWPLSSVYNTIHRAVYKGIITIPFSVSIIEESLPVLKSTSKLRREANYCIFEELFSPGLWIRPHTRLLKEEFFAYATYQKPPARWAPGMDWSKYLKPEPEREAEVLKWIEESAKEKNNNLLQMNAWRKFSDSVQDKSLYKKDFSYWWKTLSRAFVESQAQFFGILKECEKRGLDGLLELPAVRVYIGYSVSSHYSKFKLGEKFTRGDSRDHHHSVQATAASIFVTHDVRLVKILERIPNLPYYVTDLDGLVRWIRFRERVSYYDYLSPRFDPK